MTQVILHGVAFVLLSGAIGFAGASGVAIGRGEPGEVVSFTVAVILGLLGFALQVVA